MLKYIIRITLLHATIMALYLFISLLLFIRDKGTNDPFGVTFHQYFLEIAQIIITTIFIQILGYKYGIDQIGLKILINILVIIILFSAYVYFGTAIWRLVWDLKGAVMQRN
jgi:hypothetical protein